MKISLPYLRMQGKYFGYYKSIWENLITEYNKDKSSNKKLKAEHRQFYFELLHLVKNHLISERITNCCSDDLWIKTSRKKLGKILNRHPHTIYKYIVRLIEASVLVKIFHGSRADFELQINSDFILLYDRANLEHTPSSKYIKSSLSITQKASSAKRITKKSSSTGDSNNILMDDKVLTSTNENANQNNKNSFQNTTKHINYKLGASKNDKEKSCAKKENLAKQEVIDLYCEKFYGYLKSEIFFSHNIFEAEDKKSLKYLKSNYFQRINSYRDADRNFEILKWCVDAAARYRDKHDYDFSNIYPRKYLDLENPKGFAATKKWYLRNIEYEKLKLKKKDENSQKNELHKIISDYAQNPTIVNFRTCENLIKTKTPLMIDKFYKNVLNIRYA